MSHILLTKIIIIYANAIRFYIKKDNYVDMTLLPLYKRFSGVVFFFNYTNSETVFLLLQQGNTGPLGREGIIGPTGRTVSLS